MPAPAVAGAVFEAVALAAAAKSINTAGSVNSGLANAAKDTQAAVAGLASTLVNKLMGPLQSVQQLASEIGKFVELANPAVMQQFTIAMNDTMAVIGHALVPVMEALTTYTRAYGDALAKLMPVMQPLFDAIGDFIAGGAMSLAPLMQAFAPFLQLLVDGLAEGLHVLGRAVAFFQGILIEFLNTLAMAFGLQSRFKPEASSRGAAVRPAQVGSVAETASRMFREAAQNMIVRPGDEGKKKDPAEFMAEIAKSIALGQQTVKEIKELVQKLWEWFTQGIKNLDEALPGGVGGTASLLERALGLQNIRRILLK